MDSSTPSKCPTCGAEGKLQGFELLGTIHNFIVFPCKCQDEKIAAEKEKERREAEARRYEYAGFLPRLMGCTLESWQSWQPHEVEKALRDYAADIAHHIEKGNGLLLSGPPGTGKTHAAVALAHEAMKLPWTSALIVTSPDMFRALRPQNDDSHKDMEWRLRTIRFLVIDDLGKAKSTEWSEEILYSIVNHRLNTMLPIIATTNHGHAALVEHIGEAIVDRLLQACKPIKFSGESVRQKMRPDF